LSHKCLYPALLVHDDCATVAGTAIADAARALSQRAADAGMTHLDDSAVIAIVRQSDTE